MDRIALHTGGCQCGAVRYAFYAEPTNAHICHCRMCQKQFGSFFAPLVDIARDDFAWTRGEPGNFRSSEAAQRGFCRECGTPLTCETLEADHINIAIGSLDEPSRVPPEKQYGLESRLRWFGDLDELPGETTTEQDYPPEFMAKLASRQHPDHDTKSWPPPK